MTMQKNLQILCALPGVSGKEDLVREEILRQIQGLCEYTVDPLGNILAFAKGKKAAKNKVLLSAHMDEVGFIITMIEDGGLLRFSCVGGIDTRVLVGKSVRIGEKNIYGVIGAKAVHLQEEDERENPPKVERLYMDIGATNQQEALEWVNLGDRASFDAPFVPLGGGKIMAKALDDRAGCALLIQMLQDGMEYDCHFAFTVQEEIGCIGAKTAGYTIAPDVAVAVESTTASDIAGVSPESVVCRLGKGPVVSFMDRGTVYDMGLFQLAKDIAKKEGIPCQTKEGVFGGNESRSVQTAAGGARVLAVSLPCRYLHSPSNVIDTGDLDSTLALLHAFAKEAAQL